MKKFLALLLVAVMATFAFASCSSPKEPTMQELITKADTAFETEKYKVTTTLDISSDNEALDEAFEMILGNTTIDIYVDGKNVSVETTVSIDDPTDDDTADDAITVTTKTSLVNNLIYFSVDDQKFKAIVPQDMLDEIYHDMGPDKSEYDPADFENVSMQKTNGKYVITCTSYNNDEINAAFAELEAAIEAMGAMDISAENVALVMIINDGKYESITMSMDFEFSIMDQQFSFSVSAGLNVDYSAGKKIEPPLDVYDYIKVDFEELAGVIG